MRAEMRRRLRTGHRVEMYRTSAKNSGRGLSIIGSTAEPARTMVPPMGDLQMKSPELRQETEHRGKMRVGASRLTASFFAQMAVTPEGSKDVTSFVVRPVLCACRIRIRRGSCR